MCIQTHTERYTDDTLTQSHCACGMFMIYHVHRNTDTLNHFSAQLPFWIEAWMEDGHHICGHTEKFFLLLFFFFLNYIYVFYIPTTVSPPTSPAISSSHLPSAPPSTPPQRNIFKVLEECPLWLYVVAIFVGHKELVWDRSREKRVHSPLPQQEVAWAPTLSGEAILEILGWLEKGNPWSWALVVIFGACVCVKHWF